MAGLSDEGGVYTRVGATSRPADLDYVREIMIENSPQGFDRTPNRDVELTDDGIEALCARMKEVSLARSRSDEEREAVKDVTKSQLLKWGVLLKRDGKLVPTNAYALLTGEGRDFTWKIQCGVFRGDSRVVFLDRREYDGSVMDQIEAAYQYALSKINMGANFDYLVRRDEYEIPMWPIRELITNAILHRSYLAASSVQVCLYDDRLEISSPGGLKRGLRLEDALAGQSEIRNKAVVQCSLNNRTVWPPRAAASSRRAARSTPSTPSRLAPPIRLARDAHTAQLFKERCTGAGLPIHEAHRELGHGTQACAARDHGVRTSRARVHSERQYVPREHLPHEP